MREHYNMAEKRCSSLQSEREEAMIHLEAAERTRRQAEADAHDIREQVNDLSSQIASLSSSKRKIEGEYNALHAELDEALTEARTLDDKAKKAMIDAARMADELRGEQEHSAHLERQRKAAEVQIKEMQARLEEAEAAALKGGKRVIQKLEQRVNFISNFISFSFQAD